MKVKEETKERFVNVLQELVLALKSESDSCSEVCGGLSEKEMLVLAFVGQNQVVKMSDIADNIDAPMSTLTSIADKLVEKGFLAREHSSEDRRAINVTLAATGKTAFKTMVGQKKKTAEKLLARFSEKEQALFLDHIELLTSYLGTKK